MAQHALRKYRAERGLSRDQLANLIGCTPAMVSHIENGIRRASVELAMRADSKGVPKELLRPDVWPSAA